MIIRYLDPWGNIKPQGAGASYSKSHKVGNRIKAK